MWQSFWTLQPEGIWTRNAEPLQSRLLRFRYLGDAQWLDRYTPRLYCRVHVAGAGNLANWLTLWPKDGEQEVFEFPALFGNHYLELRKRNNFESLQAEYEVEIEQFVSEFYEIPNEPGQGASEPEVVYVSDIIATAIVDSTDNLMAQTGIASLSKPSAARYLFTFTQQQANTNYRVHVTPYGSNVGKMPQLEFKTLNQFEVFFRRTNDNAAVVASGFDLTVFKG